MNKGRKWFLRIFLALVVLLVLLWLLIQTAPVQNAIKDQLLTQLSKKYDASWTIEDIAVHGFDEIEATGILLLDQQSDTLLFASRLYIDIGLFSLLAKQIVVDEIAIDNLRSKLYDDGTGKTNYAFLVGDTQESTGDNAASSWTFDLGGVKLQNPYITYSVGDISTEIRQSKVEVAFTAFDLNQGSIKASKLLMSSGDIYFSKKSSTEIQTAESLLPDIGLEIEVDNIVLDEQSTRLQTAGQEIQVKAINSKVKGLSWRKSALTAELSSFSAAIDEYPAVERLSFHLSIDGNTITAEDLQINTEQDRIKASTLMYDTGSSEIVTTDAAALVTGQTLSLLKPYLPKGIKLRAGTALSVTTETLRYDGNTAHLQNTTVDYGKALHLTADLKLKSILKQPTRIEGELYTLRANLPQMRQVFTRLSVPEELDQFEVLKANARVKGSLNKLYVTNLTASLDDKAKVDLAGSISNISLPSALMVDFNIRELYADTDSIELPKVDAIALERLGQITYKGTLGGSLKTIDLAGALTTGLGFAELDAKLSGMDTPEQMVYGGDIKLVDFDLGTLLRREDVGRLSLSTNIRGKGTNIDAIAGKVKSTIQSVVYNGYEYNDIDLDADMSNQKLVGSLKINDENIALTYSGSLDMEGGVYKADFTSTIDTLILAKLGLAADTFGLSGRVRSQFSLPLKPGEKGSAAVYDFAVNNTLGTYREDSIVVQFAKDMDSTYIDFDSDFMELSIAGQFGVRDLPLAILRQVDHYYPLSIEPIGEVASRSASIRSTIRHVRPLDIMTPSSPLGLKQGVLDLDLDFTTWGILAHGNIDSLVYGGQLIEKTLLKASTNNDNIIADVSLTNVVQGDQILLPSVKTEHTIRDGKVKSDFVITDTDELPIFKFGTALINEQNRLAISVTDSIILNRKDWFVEPTNEVIIKNGSVLVNDFTLYNEGEVLSIQSLDTIGNDFRATFDDFNIGQFATLITQETTDLQLALNGEVTIRDATKQLYYTADISVDSITYEGKLVGKLSATAAEDPNSRIVRGEISLVGPDNDLIGKGSYDPKTTSIDFGLVAKRLEMRLLDPFLTSIIDDSRGTVAAKATVSGRVDKPTVEGSLQLQNVSTTILVTNSRYTVADHTIRFDNSSIDLTGLSLTDKNNNQATVNGKVRHQNLDNINLDVQVDTDKFQFLNTTAKNNPVFYGRLMLKATASVKGPPDLLDVKVAATTLDSTKLTLSPFSETESILREDFIHYGKPSDLEAESAAYLLRLARKYPFDVSLTMTATPEASMTFVVNPLTGDKIVAKGSGDLKVNLTSDGQQEIFGKYEVAEGSYSFSYGDFITKDFEIQPGGSIRFNGDPLQAKLDIKAIYKVYTTTYELIKNEVSISESEIQAAKERTDVDVSLSMQGSLLEPQIFLDIQIPDQQSASTVGALDRKLQELQNNPNELNNQVFGLLIFDSFLISDNAGSGVNNVGSSIALSSISSLVTSQLNKLASDLITGVDINIDVNSYNSNYVNDGAGGNVTEIGLQVSKQLFNDRLSVTAGTNLNLDNSVGSRATSIVGDFILEYKLTASGRYRVRVFTKTDYDRIINENATKSGVSLYFNKSFDSKTKEK